MSPRQKKATKIGTLLALLTSVATGGSAFYKSGSNDNQIQTNKSEIGLLREDVHDLLLISNRNNVILEMLKDGR